MSTERISIQVERLFVLVERHTLLTNISTDLPHHENTIARLRQQFEAHISFLLVNLESYTALQASITTTITQHPEDIIADAFPVPPLLQFLRKPLKLLVDTLDQETTLITPCA